MDVLQKRNLESLLVEKHSEKLMQFAIQNGYSIKISNQIVERAFIQFFNSEIQMDDESLLYQFVIAEMKSRDPDGQLKDQFFSFEEDEKLHQKISQLKSEIKLPFILSRFHRLSQDEISKILGMSSNEINNAIEEVNRSLRGRMNPEVMDKRLDFLSKSYERIKFQFEVENVLQQLRQTSAAQKKVQWKIPKALIYWTAGIIAIITLGIVLIMNSTWYQQATAERYINGLEESFEQALSSKLIEMGIGEVPIDEQKQLKFIIDARESFNRFNEKLELQREANHQTSKKDIEREYNRVLQKLQTPSEMAESLFEKPLVNDKEQSDKFLNRFFEQYFSVREIYFVNLNKYTGYIVNEYGLINEQFNKEDFSGENNHLPEEFLLLIDGMEKQNFHFVSIANLKAMYPQFSRNDFSEKLRNSLHEDVRSYITLIEYEPFTLNPGLAYPIEQTIEFIKEFEETLLSPKYNNHRHYLHSVYTRLLYEITVGSIPTDLYNQWGYVRIEYHEAWKEIAAFGDNSPSAFIMREVVRKMENQNWKKLMIQPELDMKLFHDALELAMAGDLKDFNWERDLESGRIFAFYNDLEFPLAVHDLYKQFSIDHDLSKLKDVSPLEIVGVYDYANDLGDPITMWHLLHKEKNSYSLEEYIADWKQHTPIYKQADVIYAGSEGQIIDDSLLVTVSYQKENATAYFGTMKRDKESSTWLLYEIYDQP